MFSSASVDAFLESPHAICALTYRPLDVQSIIASVHDEAAGATAIFIGFHFSPIHIAIASLIDMIRYHTELIQRFDKYGLHIV
jgi:molybdopterin synthase catalytic subunit